MAALAVADVAAPRLALVALAAEQASHRAGVFGLAERVFLGVTLLWQLVVALELR